MEVFCLIINLGRLDCRNKLVFVGRNSCQFQWCPLKMVGTKKQENHTTEPEVSMHLKDLFPVSHFHLPSPHLTMSTVFKLSLQAEESSSQNVRMWKIFYILYFLPASKAHDHLTIKIYSQYFIFIVLQCLNSINNIQNSTSKLDTNLTWKILKSMVLFPQS